jgi:hypothetical protein
MGCALCAFNNIDFLPIKKKKPVGNYLGLGEFISKTIKYDTA